jgi:acetyl-CoA carboxylase biotin carboxylase subunit
VEVRINAEDPARGFAPCPGTVTRWVEPVGGGLRIDTHCYGG